MKRDLLSLRDWTQQELLDCLSLAAELKAAGPMGSYSKALEGRSYALIFIRIRFELGSHLRLVLANWVEVVCT